MNYMDWLKKQGIALFPSGREYWRLYSVALIPVTPFICFTEVGQRESDELLERSGAWFIRYSSLPGETETEWWYVVCDSYNPEALSANTRSKINRGNRKCTLERIEPLWLSEHGHACYSAAYKRYRHVHPIGKEVFKKNILTTKDGPFEYWGVFVNGKLAGFCQCIIDGRQVATSILKFDPDYLKNYTSYVLISGIVDHYVAGREMIVTNGNRSILHETNIQDFLLKIGFRRQFCHLNIVYKPWLDIIVRASYPFRKLIRLIPEQKRSYKVRSLLYQEELRRKSNAAPV